MARHFPGLANSFLRLSATIPDYPLSFSFWVKPAVVTTTVPLAKGYENATGTFAGDHTTQTATGYQIVSSQEGSVAFAEATLSVTVGQWYHVLLVYAGNSLRKIWVNGTITATSAGTIAHGAAQNYIALGGILNASPIPTAAYPFSGDIADVGFWTTALDAADALALAGGARPGSISASSLVGWWPLTEGGDLNSIPSYLPFVAYGTVTDVADPPGLDPIGSFVSKLIHSPRKFTPNPAYLFGATTPDAPSRDKLSAWIPATSPLPDSNAAWNRRTGHAPSIATGKLLTGEDNSFRVTNELSSIQTDYAHASDVVTAGQTWACWLKVYKFTGNGTVRVPAPFLHFYPEYAGAYVGFFGYFPDDSGWSVERRLVVQRALGIVPAVESDVVLPLGEWIHVAVTFPLNSVETFSAYTNGNFRGTFSGNLGAGSATINTAVTLGGAALTSGAIPDCAIKDVRVYSKALTADELYQVYLHSLDFHTATSDLIRTDIRPVRIEEALDYIPGEAGVFELAGQAVGLSPTRKMASNVGGFLLSGQSALLRSTRHLTADATAYTFDGKAVNLELIRKILADHGVFTMLGNDILIEIVRMLRVEPGAFLIDGKRATFLYDIPTALDFHTSLARLLYPEMLERERATLFGANSTCTLYSVSPGQGEEILITLDSYWNARRVPTIESGAIEQWRLEIANTSVNWEMLANVSTVLITPDTGEVQRYRVMQTENAMKPGSVYHLRIEAIAQI